MTIDDLKRFLHPLKQRVSLMIGRAILHAIDDSGKAQFIRIEMNGDEVIEGVERIQPYGFETLPPADGTAEAVIFSIGGSHDLAFTTCVQARKLRPRNLVSGETQFWSKFGQKIYLKSDGSVLLEVASGKNINENCATHTVTASTKSSLKAPVVELSDAATLYKLIDERIVAKINAFIQNEYALHMHPTAGTGAPSAPTIPGTPLVLTDFSTTKTKAG